MTCKALCAAAKKRTDKYALSRRSFYWESAMANEVLDSCISVLFAARDEAESRLAITCQDKIAPFIFARPDIASTLPVTLRVIYRCARRIKRTDCPTLWRNLLELICDFEFSCTFTRDKDSVACLAAPLVFDRNLVISIATLDTGDYTNSAFADILRKPELFCQGLQLTKGAIKGSLADELREKIEATKKKQIAQQLS